MPINKDKKLAFIHITRTGGVSLCNSLNFEVEGGHAYYDFYDKNHPGYFKFAIIREPKERFISAYFFMQKFDKIYPHKARYHHLYDNGVEMAIKNLRENGTYLFRSQVNFICDSDGKVCVDKVFKSINEAFDFLVKEFGFQGVKLLHLNSTSHKDFVLSKELEKQIYDFYKKDVDLWNMI